MTPLLLAAPARASLRHRVAAGLRSLLWRSAFSLTGGLSVEGALPRGGCVVVANHGSHADAPALLAALGAAPAPRVAAAADYWFAGGARARVCRALVGGFAVRRGGGGADDLAGAVALLRSGRSVVVFPEGTRSRDGELGRFRSGAFRLAEQAGVPVVPVGIVGTRDVLPACAGGRPRRAPVTVRIGPSAGSAGQARAAVERLVAAPARPPRSRLGAAVARLATSRAGPALVLAWAVAEAVSWPLVPELVVGALVLAAPSAGPRLTAAAVAGSLAGGVLALSLAAAGVHPPAPLTTERMRAAVSEQTAAEGAAAVRHQPLAGIPYKLYAAEAGRLGVPVAAFVEHSTTSRGVRIAVVGLLLTAASTVLRRPLRRLYPLVLLVALTGFGLGLLRVVQAWS